MSSVSRFAPSTTGRAHPGTLLAGLLCWLDARRRGGRVVLRLEDLDPLRSSPEKVAGLAEDLDWLGLDWDLRERQSEHGDRHRLELDRLRVAGRLYPCACSRSDIQAVAERAPDGGWIYPGTCRGRTVAPEAPHCWRFRLDAEDDERVLGDPVVVRRDGAVAYQLASVIDDAAVGVTHVVRGRDLLPSTAVQVALRRALGHPEVRYRHHLLLLEERGEKLAKLHGAVGAPELRAVYDAESLCGWLAHVAGLRPEPVPCRPRDLVADFSWERVEERDQVVRWTGERLERLGPGGSRAGLPDLGRNPP